MENIFTIEGVKLSHLYALYFLMYFWITYMISDVIDLYISQVSIYLHYAFSVSLLCISLFSQIQPEPTKLFPEKPEICICLPLVMVNYEFYRLK